MVRRSEDVTALLNSRVRSEEFVGRLLSRRSDDQPVRPSSRSARLACYRLGFSGSQNV